MTIPNFSGLKQDARQALSTCPGQKQIALIYTAVVVGLSLLLTAGDYILSDMISNTGGLGNLGTRSILSALQTMLPIVQMLVLLGLNAGYSLSVLKIIRREHADQNTLISGFSLFWPMLRAMLLEAMIYCALTMLSFYIAMMVYMFSPWSNNLVAILEPFLPSILSGAMPVLEDAVVYAALESMIPMLIIFCAVYFGLSIPVSYRLRMSTFCLVDAPRAGAIRALATSRLIMHRNCFRLFKLDVSFWWYHGLLALASLIQMLPLLGILPWDFNTTYYVCYGIYMAMITGLYVTVRNRVETTYAAVYESLREKPQESAVVLGNIFDM